MVRPREGSRPRGRVHRLREPSGRRPAAAYRGETTASVHPGELPVGRIRVRVLLRSSRSSRGFSSCSAARSVQSGPHRAAGRDPAIVSGRSSTEPTIPGPRLIRERQVVCAAALEYAWGMNRGTGTGLIAFGVVLGVVGAIMALAITVRTRGFNINTAGWIVLVVGIIVLLIGIAILVTGSRRSSTTVENVQNTPSGQERVEERRDWGSS
jgi:hypothetical protein